MFLDQLQAFHVFAALPLTSGVAGSDLDAARIAMRRAPYSAAIERYALLAGINGRDADAVDALSQCASSKHRSSALAAVTRGQFGMCNGPDCPRA